jgi:hypothetical protein
VCAASVWVEEAPEDIEPDMFSNIVLAVMKPANRSFSWFNRCRKTVLYGHQEADAAMALAKAFQSSGRLGGRQ